MRRAASAGLGRSGDLTAHRVRLSYEPLGQVDVSEQGSAVVAGPA